MRKRGTVCPLFKLRVVGITRNRKDSTNRSSTQLREAAMSNFFYFKTTQGNASLLKTFFAMIENFLRFQLARKSITLLFLFQNVLAPFRMPQAPIESYYGQRYDIFFIHSKHFRPFFVCGTIFSVFPTDWHVPHRKGGWTSCCASRSWSSALTVHHQPRKKAQSPWWTLCLYIYKYV